MSDVRVFGIRHHGPGSARSLLRAWAAWEPEVVLVEGPPDAESALSWMDDAGLEPPVALLVYARDEPGRAVFYPFATFSPEWQALRWARARGVPARFIDLPQTHRLVEPEEVEKKPARPERGDGLDALASAAGYRDGEHWWDRVVESQAGVDDPAAVFDAVHEAMAAVREGVELEPLEARREAHMRKCIRAAKREFERVAVVCGAYHAPALTTLPTAKSDNALLKGLAKVKTECAWVPWTYDRLSLASGYGAGIVSPEWYRLVWNQAGETAVPWLTRVATVLREADLDASSAHVIEAVRLADTLAAMRGERHPGLLELQESAQTVICSGDDVPMRLVQRRLILGERMGTVPESAPQVPLQKDLERTQKRLRLPPRADERTLELDLRKENDLARSRLLHRLRLLGIDWGETRGVGGKRGTFHEHWALCWQPEFAVRVIVASRWGNTVAQAASGKAVADAHDAPLPHLTTLLDDALLADLDDAVRAVTRSIQARGVDADVLHLMAALPRLVRISRYGNVRNTDAESVGDVARGLLTRVAAGLFAACYGLNDDAAEPMREAVGEVHDALQLLDEESRSSWYEALQGLAADTGSIHGSLQGRANRLLLDARVLDADTCARRLSLALSRASDPAEAAAWVEGFLQGGGLVLLHDEALWNVVDRWVSSMPDAVFTEILPLVRRTFATFPPAERRQIGTRVVSGRSGAASMFDAPVDDARGAAALPIVARLLGLEPAEDEA